MTAIPLNAPQPFSNAPEADFDAIERRFVRTTSIGNPRVGSGKRKFNRRIHQRDRRLSSTSRTSKGGSMGSNTSSSNNMEPENDVGALPLSGNVVRKPSFAVSDEEVAKMPYASVAVVGSNSTRTTAVSNEESTQSHHGPLHINNNLNTISTLEKARQISYQKKFAQVSRVSKTSFAGDIVSSTRSRRKTSNVDAEKDKPVIAKGKMAARMSDLTTEGRFSSTSFSLEVMPDSREISQEFNVVADVVDEAQLEAEFERRLKSRIVEAVEIRPTHTTDEENPHNNDHNSYTNNSYSNFGRNRTLASSSSKASSRNGGSCRDESSESQTPEWNASGGSAEEAETPTPQELAKLRQRRRTIRCIVSWTGFLLVSGILIAVLVVFLRFSELTKKGFARGENTNASLLQNVPAEPNFITPTADDLIIDDDR